MKSLLNTVAGAVVLGAMAMAFYLSGTPSENRALRRDELRVADLGALHRKIAFYTRTVEERPGQLSEVLDWCRNRSAAQCRELGADEATAFEYRPVNDLTYELCTTFERPSPRRDNEALRADPAGHDAGRACYLYIYPKS